GRDHPSWVVPLLVHADGAVHAVVGDHDHNRQVVLHGRRELLAGHHEIAVAREGDDRALGHESFGGNRGWHAVAHGAGDRRELRGIVSVTPEAVNPDVEVSSAVTHDGIGRQHVAKSGNDLAEVDRARHRRGLIGPGDEVGVRGWRRRGPGGRVRARQAFEWSRKGGPRGMDGEGRAVDAAKLLDAGIDMYERLLRPGDVDEGVALGGHFAEPAANQDDEIGVLYARKEFWVRSDAEVAGVAGMLRIEEMRP